MDLPIYHLTPTNCRWFSIPKVLLGGLPFHLFKVLQFVKNIWTCFFFESKAHQMGHYHVQHGTAPGGRNSPQLDLAQLRSQNLSLLGSKLPLFPYIYNRGWEKSTPIVGVKIGPHYKDSVIKGWRSPIPNTRSLDPGSNDAFTLPNWKGDLIIDNQCIFPDSGGKSQQGRQQDLRPWHYSKRIWSCDRIWVKYRVRPNWHHPKWRGKVRETSQSDCRLVKYQCFWLEGSLVVLVLDRVTRIWRRVTRR